MIGIIPNFFKCSIYNRYIVCVLLLLCLSVSYVYAQTTLRGIVTDVSGEPLPGVSIMVKGSTMGTVSGLDGDYSIKANSQDILVFSFIGMTTKEVYVGGKTTINVTLLDDTKLLDEVIVVGYGTQKKMSITGSVAQVSSDELRKAPSSNLSTMLQGKLPGLVATQNSGQPGHDATSMMVRGAGNGDGNVLVVVDGIVRPFPSISPDEIESVTILKDAASAAVYGFNGSAGVILITTKRGSNQKPTVILNSSMSLSTNTCFPKFLNGPNYMKWYNRSQELDGYSKESLRFTDDEIARAVNGDPMGVYTSTDWFNLIFKGVALSYNNNISLSGGNERFKYFVGLGAYNQNGVIEHTGYDRYNLRTNIDAKVTTKFSVSLGVGIRHSNTTEPSLGTGAIMQQAMLAYPFLPATTYSGLPVGSLNAAGNGNQNPLAVRDLGGELNIREKRMETNITLKYDIPGIKGLTAKLTASYDYFHRMSKSEKTPYKLSVYNQSTHNWSEAYGRLLSDGLARVQQDYVDQYDFYLQPSLAYQTKIGKHNINTLFLYEYGGVKYTSMSAGKWGYPVDDILDLTWGDEVIPNSVGGIHNKGKRAGYVVRLNYDYADKYLMEVSARIDGTQMLPSQNRWCIFPGISLGWRISEEPFMKESLNLEFIDNLKLRASFGQLGSQTGLGYGLSYLAMASLSSLPVMAVGNTLTRYLNIGSIPNTDLKWQYTNTYNIGFDAMFWRGLLGVEFDMFYSLTKRKIEQQSGAYPPSLGGYYSPLVNSGEHENKGFELVLTHQNKVDDINYSIKGNLSWTRNKILKINETTNVPEARRLVGKPMGQYYGFVSDGLFQSEEDIATSAVFGPTLPGDIKLVDINGDGKITMEQDMVPIGRSNIPEMTFGLNLSADWKGFDFNAFFQGSALFDVYLCGTYNAGFVDDTFYTRPFYADGNAPYYLVEGAWTPENRNADYPRLSTEARLNGGKYSDWWVKNGTYLRLKNAQIGYTLPVELTKKIGIEKVRAYVSGSNLFTITGVDYFDPEMPNVNQGYYPQQRVYEFGVNISF